MTDAREKAFEAAAMKFVGDAEYAKDFQGVLKVYYEAVEAALWQPIETAPKDGTWIILQILSHSNEMHAVQAQWISGEWRGLQDIEFAAIACAWRPDVDLPANSTATE